MTDPKEHGKLPEHSGAPIAGASGSYGDILSLTGPLILSSTGLMLMHLVDALFLAWHSEEAIAVVGPASMAGFLALGLFLGIAGYTSTFVAQYIGANRPERAAAAVWQGIYVAMLAGIVVAIGGSLLAMPLFEWVGHDVSLRGLEAQYFRIMCWGAPVSLCGTALSGFFSGRGDNRTLMGVQLGGFVINLALSYGLIFGHFGLPNLGASGAAIATVCAQVFNTLLLTALFFHPKHRAEFATWKARHVDRNLMKRLLYFGSFNGMRFVAEIFAWTLFLFFIGRIGKSEMAVTNIVWRLNGLAFLPLMGLSTAIATLVGHAQGGFSSARAEKVAYRGVIIAEAWMVFAALLFVALPRQLLGLFTSEHAGMDSAEMIETGVVLLRFVALYCLLDGFNLIFMAALQGAGDTRWTLVASFFLHLTFLIALLLMDQAKRSVYEFWGAATAFVMLQALVWLARFRTGRWKEMRVIEFEAAR